MLGWFKIDIINNFIHQSLKFLHLIKEKYISSNFDSALKKNIIKK